LRRPDVPGFWSVYGVVATVLIVIGLPRFRAIYGQNLPTLSRVEKRTAIKLYEIGTGGDVARESRTLGAGVVRVAKSAGKCV
jgi:hypothetical protein